MHHLTNFIFDWSGTLVDDLPPVVHATNAVLRHCGRPALTRAEFLREFELPFHRFYDRMVPGIPLTSLEPIFHEAFTRSEERATPIPHSHDFLEWCRRQGHRCFVLSAAHPAHLDDQARAFGLDPYFEAIHAGVRDKSERIHHLLDHHQLRPELTAFIGDMTHDIESARHGGVFSVAVLTGYQDLVRLAAVSPDLVVHDLAELRSLLHPMDATSLSLK
ncbi:MAG: HAD family hydrolase [Verrucomicrobiales bacterium]